MYYTTHNVCVQQHTFYRCLLCNIVFVVQYIYTNSYTQYLYVYLYHKYHQTWNNVFHSWSIECVWKVCALCTCVVPMYIEFPMYGVTVYNCTDIARLNMALCTRCVCTYIVCKCERVIWVLVFVCMTFDWLCVWKCWESTL